MTDAERRAIEARIGRTLEDHVIRLKQATQAYVATFLRQPELAKKNPKRMFLSMNDGGSFERIFNTDLSAEKYVLAQRLAWAAEAFIKQFMTRKRRKDRVDDWRADYSSVLGVALIDQHAEILDQVVPQSAVFLAALAYEDWVRIHSQDLHDLLSALDAANPQIFRDHLDLLIRYGKSDKSMASSWPTLLKSQAFFENVASYLKGLHANKSEALGLGRSGTSH